MIKKMRFLIWLVVALMMTSPALAQGPITPKHTDPNWQASYWNNTTLSGTPVLQISETNLDHDWGGGSPAPGVNADQFSARWMRYIDVTPGTYRFTVTADDGMRVWVDDELIIDQWRDQPPTTYTAQKYLGPGHHLVRVEYYENLGGAVAKVSWMQAPKVGGWRGEYYNNKSLSGSPALVRDDPEINFYWGSSSPAPGQIDADGFSVRWSRSLDLPRGNYRFTMTVDDGARLFVNGHLLIDAWKDQPPRTYTGDLYLPGGPITAQMEYYENTGGAVAQLAWAIVDSPPPPPPPTDRIGSVTVYRLNVRSGPGLNYPINGGLYRGQQVRLLGRNSAATWLKMEAAPNFQGWVYAYYIYTNFPIAELPVIQ